MFFTKQSHTAQASLNSLRPHYCPAAPAPAHAHLGRDSAPAARSGWRGQGTAHHIRRAAPQRQPDQGPTCAARQRWRLWAGGHHVGVGEGGGGAIGARHMVHGRTGMRTSFTHSDAPSMNVHAQAHLPCTCTGLHPSLHPVHYLWCVLIQPLCTKISPACCADSWGRHAAWMIWRWVRLADLRLPVHQTL